MKCSKCKKNYKNIIPTCPKCGEVNSSFLEDKTMAIVEIDKEMSLTGLISNQIEKFNENDKVVKKDEIINKKKSKESKFGSKRDIQLRKRILMFGMVISSILVFIIIGLVIYFKNISNDYDYLYELNLILDDYNNINDKTEIYDILDYVYNDDEKIKVVHNNICNAISDWIVIYKQKEYYSIEEFDKVTSILKGNISYLFDIDYKNISLLEYDEYETFNRDINNYYNDGKLYYQAIGYYNKKYYNESFAMFDAINEDNQFYSKAEGYKDKIIDDVLILLNKDIEKLESNIKDDSVGNLEIYLEIENVIVVYDDVYSNLNLSQNIDYQKKLEKYRKFTINKE